MGLRNGQLRIIEAALAGVIALFVLSIVSWLAYPRTIYTSYSAYASEAGTILKLLADRNVLCQAVYGSDGSVNGEILVTLVEGFMPSEWGYRISVSRLDDTGKMNEIFVFESGNFKMEKASSSYVILSGCNGIFEPRIVVLSISGGG
jgi:hypothetical protein